MVNTSHRSLFQSTVKRDFVRELVCYSIFYLRLYKRCLLTSLSHRSYNIYHSHKEIPFWGKCANSSTFEFPLCKCYYGTFRVLQVKHSAITVKLELSSEREGLCRQRRQSALGCQFY